MEVYHKNNLKVLHVRMKWLFQIPFCSHCNQYKINRIASQFYYEISCHVILIWNSLYLKNSNFQISYDGGNFCRPKLLFFNETNINKWKCTFRSNLQHYTVERKWKPCIIGGRHVFLKLWINETPILWKQKLSLASHTDRISFRIVHPKINVIIFQKNIRNRAIWIPKFPNYKKKIIIIIFHYRVSNYRVGLL